MLGEFYTLEHCEDILKLGSFNNWVQRILKSKVECVCVNTAVRNHTL